MNLTLQSVPVEHIVEKSQPRKVVQPEGLAGLKASITAVGLQQPLLCTPEGDRWLLIDGMRRLLVCRELGWTRVPILVARDQVSAGDVLLRQLICNMQREDLTPIEKAEGIQQYMDMKGLTGGQAAVQLGQSAATVSRMLAVLRLPDPIKLEVAAGRIVADAAYLLGRVNDPERQAEFAQELAHGRLTRDELQRQLRRTRPRGKRSDTTNRVTAVLDAGRSVTVVGKNLSFDSVIETLEQLLTRARKAKGQGISLATFVRTLRDQAA